jgi:multidrug efflux pump subunit AcrB
MLLLAGLLAVSLFAFGFVSQLFFPDSSRPQLMIDYWAPAGTRIEEVSESLKPVEKKIMQSPYVESVSTFVGAGPPRFYLPVDPEKPFPYYAQMIVNLHAYEDIAPFITEMEPWIVSQVPNKMVRFRKYGVGPGDTWKFAARFSGPSNASLSTLRDVGNEVLDIVRQSPYGRDWRLDMMNRRLKLVPEYSQKRGRWSSVSRVDLGATLKRGYDGVPTGLYREGEHLYPIIVRATEEERRNIASNMGALQIKPELSTRSVPVLQVVNAITPEWEDPQIIRWNRRRAVTVEGGPKDGFTFDQLRDSVVDKIDALKLPPGYELFWDGEADSSASAKKSLLPGVVPAVVIVLLMLVMVFNAFRPVAIILLTIPFAFIGVAWSLLIFDVPFGFLALLGAMSLAGMMNKNIVILLDACNENLDEGMSHYDAIVEAAVTRLRPVLLAAGTTVLGVVPLIPDVFWVGMAVTIMGGLAFGSILTLIVVPVLYALFYNIKVPEKKEGSDAA